MQYVGRNKWKTGSGVEGLKNRDDSAKNPGHLWKQAAVTGDMFQKIGKKFALKYRDILRYIVQ